MIPHLYVRTSASVRRRRAPRAPRARVAGEPTTANTEETLEVHNANAPKVRKNGASHWNNKNAAAAGGGGSRANTEPKVARVAQNADADVCLFLRTAALARRRPRREARSPATDPPERRRTCSPRRRVCVQEATRNATKDAATAPTETVARHANRAERAATSATTKAQNKLKPNADHAFVANSASVSSNAHVRDVTNPLSIPRLGGASAVRSRTSVARTRVQRANPAPRRHPATSSWRSAPPPSRCRPRGFRNRRTLPDASDHHLSPENARSSPAMTVRAADSNALRASGAARGRLCRSRASSASANHPDTSAAGLRAGVVPAGPAAAAAGHRHRAQLVAEAQQEELRVWVRDVERVVERGRRGGGAPPPPTESSGSRRVSRPAHAAPRRATRRPETTLGGRVHECAASGTARVQEVVPLFCSTIVSARRRSRWRALTRHHASDRRPRRARRRRGDARRSPERRRRRKTPPPRPETPSRFRPPRATSPSRSPWGRRRAPRRERRHEHARERDRHHALRAAASECVRTRPPRGATRSRTSQRHPKDVSLNKEKEKKSAFLAAECLLPRRTRRSTRAAAPESASPTRRGGGNGNPKPAGTLGGPASSRCASAANVGAASRSSSERQTALKSSTTSPGARESSTEPPPPERVRRFGGGGANVTVDRVRRWRSRLGSHPPRGRATPWGGAPTVAVRRTRIDAGKLKLWRKRELCRGRSRPVRKRGASRKGGRAGNNGGAERTPAATWCGWSVVSRASTRRSTAKLADSAKSTSAVRRAAVVSVSFSPLRLEHQQTRHRRAHGRRTPPASPCTRATRRTGVTLDALSGERQSRRRAGHGHGDMHFASVHRMRRRSAFSFSSSGTRASSRRRRGNPLARARSPRTSVSLFLQNSPSTERGAVADGEDHETPEEVAVRHPVDPKHARVRVVCRDQRRGRGRYRAEREPEVVRVEDHQKRGYAQAPRRPAHVPPKRGGLQRFRRRRLVPRRATTPAASSNGSTIPAAARSRTQRAAGAAAAAAVVVGARVAEENRARVPRKALESFRARTRCPPRATTAPRASRGEAANAEGPSPRRSIRAKPSYARRTKSARVVATPLPPSA